MGNFKIKSKKTYKSIPEWEECLYHIALNDEVNTLISLKPLGLTLDQADGIAYKTLSSKTSSDDRERIVVHYLGFIPKDRSVKHGYDGFNSVGEPLEVKTKNVDFNLTKDLEFSYNLNDCTPKSVEKDIEKNPYYALAGYIDCQLIFVITFRFNDSDKLAKSLTEQMNSVVKSIQETGKNRRTVGRIGLDNIPLETMKVHVIVSKNELIDLRHSINKNLYNILLQSANFGCSAKYVKEISTIDEMFE